MESPPPNPESPAPEASAPESIERLLFVGVNGYVAALRPGDGSEVWRTRLRAGTFDTITYATESEDVCLLVHEGRVLAGCQGYVFGLDAATGAIVWTNELKDMGFNDVTLAMHDKSVQFVSSKGRGRSS